MKHCDDYIDDPYAHPALRAYLKHARSPGHGHSSPKPHPKLFATWLGYKGAGFKGIEPGDRIRVTVCSRMGDVGITKKLDANVGYEVRTDVASLTDFSEEP